jgi:hypothetical protein
MSRGELERKLRGNISDPLEKEALRLTAAMDDFARSVEIAVAGDLEAATDALIGCRTTWGSRNIYAAALLYASKAVMELAQATGKSPRKATRRITEDLGGADALEVLRHETA